MASSTTGRTKTSDNKSNETFETIHESNKIKTTTTHFGHVTEKTVERSHHLNVSPPPDQSAKRSPHARHKRAFCPFEASPIQSNFFPRSAKDSIVGSPAPRLYARPFDEFAIVQGNSDEQGGPSIKTDGSSSSWTDKKP